MAASEPTWTEEQRRRWTRENAWLHVRPDPARFFKPGTDLSFLPKSPEQARLDAKQKRLLEERQAERAEAEAQRAAADAEAEWFRQSELRRLTAEIKLDLLRLKYLRKYSPNQPRVPAGNLDGGQWTSGGGAASPTLTPSTTDGAGRNDSRVLSDATPDNNWIPGAQYAQLQGERQYSVNLEEEDARGGHTIRDHVGKNDSELLARVQADQGPFGLTSRYVRYRQGSFESKAAANDFVNRTLERNREAVDNVASGRSDEAFVEARFGYRTGQEAFRPSPGEQPYLRDTYEVGVYIRRDTRSSRGYQVITAYPRNSSSR